ncbi:MAG TPA: hypothetical protein VFF21_05170 [Flavobacteriaceae bacterium]|nr:hypothetical protein [Aequorivita sp.]HZW77679.1 hypothetical protein [Flavobacteriaceae bacterium]
MATQEEIKRFRAIQEMQGMLALAKISQDRKQELLQMALDLQATKSKAEILLLISKKENLSPQDQRALEAILLFEM